jgi:mono/diheme cytochrome c family protein
VDGGGTLCPVQRWRIGAALAITLAAAVVVTAVATGWTRGAPSGKAPAAAAPGWAAVAPIFAEKCSGCHTVGGIAPFSLTSAKAAKAHADGIRVMTRLGRMPPWMPGGDSPAYQGQSQRILSPAEKSLIQRWVRGGARIGAGGNVKPVGSTSSAPGQTMTLTPGKAYMPKPAVNALDDYHCFVLEPQLAQDSYVTSAVIKPQRPGIVHHVILFEASGQNAVEARKLNSASGGNGWTCFGGPGLSETRPDAGSVSSDRLGAPPWISAWVPGHTNNDTPAGTGVLVHKGAAIVMQVHYNLIHKAQRDRSRAVIKFAPAATTKLTALNTLLIAAPVELPCPRGTRSALCSRQAAVQEEIRKYGFEAAVIPAGLLYLCGKSISDYPSSPASVKSLGTDCSRRVSRPLRIYGVAGHMHTRGFDIRVSLNGKTLLHIPRWNFHWQDAYYLEKPVDADVGDTIKVSCKFDNSKIKQPLVNGKLLKPRYVLWGEGTTDEMCLGLLQAADR